MKDELIFSNWMQRCSSLGHIMTCLPQPFSETDEAKLTAYIDEKNTGLNENGNKTKWTDTKQEALHKLIEKKKQEDVLPEGCITHLEDVFRSQFWGRRRILYNRYLEKGNTCEEDSLELLSQVDGRFYFKNEQQYDNGFIQGCPDNKQEHVKDTKTKWDMETFDKYQSLEHLNEWQVKGYIWLLRDEPHITNNNFGEIICTLVNNPIRQLVSERKKVVSMMGLSYEEANAVWDKIEEIISWTQDINLEEVPQNFLEMWREKVKTYKSYVDIIMQAEANMIFDYPSFKKQLQQEAGGQYQDFKLLTPEPETLTIPAHFRVKRFDVWLNDSDVENIKRRVLMCREWLINKEKQTLEKLKK